MQDPKLPQWVKSRLKFVAKEKPKCGAGSTHHICHCLQKRLIEVELRLAEMNVDKYERALTALDAGRDAKMRVFGNSMLPLIKTRSVVTIRRTEDYQPGDVVFAKVKGNYLTHKVTKVDSNGRLMIANNKGRENGWASQIFGRIITVNGESFGRTVE